MPYENDEYLYRPHDRYSVRSDKRGRHHFQDDENKRYFRDRYHSQDRSRSRSRGRSPSKVLEEMLSILKANKEQR